MRRLDFRKSHRKCPHFFIFVRKIAFFTVNHMRSFRSNGEIGVFVRFFRRELSFVCNPIWRLLVFFFCENLPHFRKRQRESGDLK